MRCPKCFSKQTRVTCTEHYENKTKRYCRCLDCQIRYSTIETYTKQFQPITLHPRQIKRGEECHLSVLTENNVRQIRLLAKEKTYAVIAKDFGIHKDTVYKIVNFKSWDHVKEETSTSISTRRSSC